MPSAGWPPGWRRLPTLTGVTSTTSHLPTYLRAALVSDSGRPRMTYYDDATGERVELSAGTLAGWVTKTVNLLTGELDVEPGTRVSLHLPLHWLTAVWIIALDACAADMIINPSGAVAQSADIAVIGPDTPLAGIRDCDRPSEVMAVSLAPMAAPFGLRGGPTLPQGARDFCAEVRTMPDQIVLTPDAMGQLNAQGAVRAQDLALSPKERLATFAGASAEQPLPLDISRLVDALVAPLSLDGSAVWVRNPDPDLCVSRWTAEQITAALSPLPAGVRAPDAVTLVD